MPDAITFIDLEVTRAGRIADIGCVKGDGQQFRGSSIAQMHQFLQGTAFLCGHNLLHHDLKYLKWKSEFNLQGLRFIDTLYLSPLLFPARPYHRLVKDNQLDPEQYNNPLSDALKTRELLADEIIAFAGLPLDLKEIFFGLLHDTKEFEGFFTFIDFKPEVIDLQGLIASFFRNSICSHAPLHELIINMPIPLAYTLSFIHSNDQTSILPPWVMKTFPVVQECFHLLRNQPCEQDCVYCQEKLDAHRALARWFGFDAFRQFEGVPLQERAVQAAIENKSLLTIFPTGGGKSITFQLPALICGDTEKGLTVVISPLQSLMKDQVDNLEKKGITEAVTINGLLDPIERAKSIERIAEGGASILYIAPESLRSNTIERLLTGRLIARFVIDEAHCFSTWGQDFRVDYLYIGDFIKKLQEQKNLNYSIPVSCFTATAKPKVIEDIQGYFKEKLGLHLALFTTKVARTNLEYKVLQQGDDKDKYQTLRQLLEGNHCPTIVYVSRTRKAEDLATTLFKDGFNAKHYHGKMDVRERLEHQNSFMNGETDIMVATSAFGMGVDKSNIGMVVHYEISDSLENYIQEAGRAGRDESIEARCYVLFNEEDLNKHFLLLNQTKLTLKEIQQVWKAVKDLTKNKRPIHPSALEIARKAGWDDEVADMETRITTAIAALEESGFLSRSNNSPRVFATGILSKTAGEAIDKINGSEKIVGDDKVKAIRIIKKLFATKRAKEASDEEAESRIDYIADHLGLQKESVINIINLLREEKILAETKDLNAFIKRNPKAESNALNQTSKLVALEYFLATALGDEPVWIHLKKWTEKASQALHTDITPYHIKCILNIWAIQGWIKKDRKDFDSYYIRPKHPVVELQHKLQLRRAFAGTIIRYLFEKAQTVGGNGDGAMADEVLVEFSVQELQEYLVTTNQLYEGVVTAKDVEDNLFYLSRIEAVKIEGGFMVLYNRLTIERKETNPHARYKKEDYQKLEAFYANKVQQIHIVGEYAQRMIRNYQEAISFVDDYFQLNYASFLAKYFPGRKAEISRTLTPQKFEQLYGGLSLEQSKIITDNESQYIVVAAGPGSGKTKVLVHKLASLLQVEDVKHEQLLMLTFSRAAATEFKSRLLGLVGNAAYFTEIKTFHAYCFDLLGKVGDLEKSELIIKEAIAKIRSNEIIQNRITKAVLVIDEAQDINDEEFELIKLLTERNEDMRVLLVGDDDQNIFEWRGASIACMRWFLKEKKASPYTLVDNYRSKEVIVSFANEFVIGIRNRLKTKPILSKQGEGGTVRITQYSSQHLVVPLVEDLIQANLQGSSCVLTRTNEEAALVAGLLRRSGYPVKLVQSNDGFPLNNLLELRFLSDCLLNYQPDHPRISKEHFESCVQQFQQQFHASTKAALVLQVVVQFRKTYPQRMYKTDWRSFLAESKLEEFYTLDVSTVFVSTIHKAKGKEFDNVFLLLNNHKPLSEEDKRLLYVAITRTSHHLHIHTNGCYFEGSRHVTDYVCNQHEFEAPPILSLVLTHEDVWLSFFQNRNTQRRIQRLLPGMSLQFTEDGFGCSFNGSTVVRFSNRFKEELKKYWSSGYQLHSASVQAVVYWKGEEEVMIVLPEVELSK
ncbi:RecQ family ATP-dependent DNA helicase [Chitinophagaceae bacterium LB-8]|uniref:DNA 3'-5' helicase n=1 Tax=Paraflavisolibacter caeni TaxID=2982496 RepID=A0A9X3BH17_9BACT|nr:RecQ family ATP-dependent DNA helicase [Paraflavisolibacter caeni]MCU7548333.1 RecQ family ATP-dependent DNA helicase [Paraflavisolibacter caeni]